MNLRRTASRETPDITLTPLIDVVFLLLIFFMVSTTFERDSALGIELTEAKPRKERIIEVAIDAQGRYYVQDKQLVNTQAKTLRRALKESASGIAPLPPVVLSADERTPYQSVVTLMDVTQQLGFSRLRFATRLVSAP